MDKKISRRQLLMLLAMASGGAGLVWARRFLGMPATSAQTGTVLLPRAYLPYVSREATPTPTPTQTPTPTRTPTSTPTSTPTRTPTPTPTNTLVPGTGPKVVHIHSGSATSWNFGNTYYGDFVSQNIVNSMVDRGVVELTGAASVAQAWQTLVPSYAPGKAIAIKVNFNNCRWCDMCTSGCEDWANANDGLIHPINSVVRGLLLAYPSLSLSDIWVYDATIGDNPSVSSRAIPGRFKAGNLYSGIRFFDYACNQSSGYSSSDPSATVTWRNPSGVPMPPAVKVTDVLVNAAYVINMPIMKRHVGAAVTLSFKNHFGSLANVVPLHDWLFGSYSSGATYNILVDIYRNPNILNKTVLTIGDGLFGNWKDNISKPQRWTTFGNQAPNSLLFATDPVAIDCVMCDLLNAENGLWAGADDYLKYATSVGLGVYERGNPWGSGYTSINYSKVEIA